MSHQFLTLKNGIRTHLIPFPGTDAATLLVLCKVGSRYEQEKINGASHFIEHLMFKGTKKRPTTLDISKALDSVGAEYNAYTGKDITGYYIKADAHHFKLAVDILHDMLFHSVFSPVEMKRERKVIIEEINMYEDNPVMHAEDLLEGAMFEGNTLGWEIAGTHHTMNTMLRKDIVAYRDAYYIPSRLVIAASGRLPDDTQGLLQKTFGMVQEKKIEPSEFTPFGALPLRKTPRAKVQEKKTQQLQIAIGFPSYPMGSENDPATKLLAIILGGTMSSRLFVSVRERRGLAYMVRAGNSPFEDTGNFMIQAGLDSSRLDLALKTIFQELRSVKKQGVRLDELKLAKQYIHGKLMLSFEDSSDRAEFYARQELFLRQVRTPEQFLEKLNRVSVADIQRVANELLLPGRLCVAGIGPFKTPAALLRHVPAL